jgi:hypothetical protein
MQVDAFALRLRPRSMNEAVDLGVRLVQANARSVWASFAPVYLLVVLLATASGAVASWLPWVIIFWLKPWLDRTLLFVLSRAVFGTPTRLADVWEARSQVWWQQWFSTLTWRRLSLWRSYTQPGLQLEGHQRSSTWRPRRKQLLHGKRGSGFRMQKVFVMLEGLLVMGITLLVVWLAPWGDRSSVFQGLFENEGALSVVSLGAYLVVVLLIEPFYVGAGFACT